MQTYTAQEVKKAKKLTKQQVYAQIADRYGDCTIPEARDIMELDYGIVDQTTTYVELAEI